MSLPLSDTERCGKNLNDDSTGNTQANCCAASQDTQVQLTQPVQQHLTLQALLDQQMPPATLLSTLLSTKSTISIDPNLEQDQADLADESAQSEHSPDFVSIGEGRLGRVYDWAHTGKVVKVCLRDDDIELRVEAAVHKIVCQAYDSLIRGPPQSQTQASVSVPFHIPQYYSISFGDEAAQWWSRQQHQSAFPTDDKKIKDLVGHALLTAERIPPLPKVLREALIDTYFRECDRAAAKKNPKNRDCLVRVYLGSQRTKFQYGILRNMPLTLAQMHALNLPLDGFVESMAAALAMMHFGAGIDAHDVEFVLGANPANPNPDNPEVATSTRLAPEHTDSGGNRNPNLNFTFRDGYLQLWVLDFNQCGDITMDETGMDSAVEAYFDNDPYFPRPYLHCYGSALGKVNLTTKEAVEFVGGLWAKFASSYIAAGKTFLKNGDKLGSTDSSRSLPAMFVEKVERRAASEMPGWKAMQ
ncbi:hypothetical protein HRR83_003929 [Exophiala dermatitidis]|uniref:DUF3669 domain-containing protein n=2 Tax=Exophiala dermatitidis TaxID=5970 RepID=H6BPZ1_EXODN|nr:uncharacterized protein HMPREF1120_01899 [Exophiala dermatitidis NIH/UT8656]KAJ4518788.1 hypothetical protein HRR75_002461 [Exophiala dermatitidis]EHY53714.1 hypothetical protein HMPREF1120_01899 [Exophiala dermatitidis NIH/UT8656]KAJ4522106.1 hypothetical protein HRR74_002686 [Exophiala dermatitidis]KAJ4529432.1 hypothetical protein HRR73_000455 [Exophiala dermatitidis]KAJ4543912.1 hypothetical protein HRR76_001971 [Exophiala dermatitidis]